MDQTRLTHQEIVAARLKYRIVFIQLAKVTHQNYTNQILQNRSFKGMELTGTDFSYSDLHGCDFTGATLVGANFTGIRTGQSRRQINRLTAAAILAPAGGELIAPLTFVGSCNHLLFEKWLGSKLLPSLKSGQTLILDNATFHKSEKIRELVKTAGCELEYLPPYSPDLNDIEHYWFQA